MDDIRGIEITSWKMRACGWSSIRPRSNAILYMSRTQFNRLGSGELSSAFDPIKDVRPQNVPTHRFFFFKLATQKGNDLLLAKREEKWGSPALFWRDKTCPEKQCL